MLIMLTTQPRGYNSKVMFKLAFLQHKGDDNQILTNIPVVWDMTPCRLLQVSNLYGVISVNDLG